MDIIKLKDEKEIDEAFNNGTKLVVLDIYAEWCGPCRLLSQKIDSMKDEFPQVTVFKVNAEDFEELTEKYSVRNVPTLIFLSDGMIVDRTVGMQEPSELTKIIEKHINE